MDVSALQDWFQDFSIKHQKYQKPLLMGILNITPDSFSDGGIYINPDDALQRARDLIEAGADIIDLGGESSRPGFSPVSMQEEFKRVIPVIEKIRKESSISISIDTTKPTIMRAAVAAGVNMINDVNALQSDGALEAAIELKVPVCLMHGYSQMIQQSTHYYHDMIDEINQFFSERLSFCIQAGIQPEHLVIDPGFGFGKTVEQNLLILKKIHDFSHHGHPILIGVSRKSTLGSIIEKPIQERLIASVTASLWASLQGASIIRTHDIEEMKQALEVVQAIHGSDPS